MAMALQKLFPEAQTTIGPWIERGFYYDFDLPTPLTPADLKAVKKEMVKIIKADLPFICEEVGLHRNRQRVLPSSQFDTAPNATSVCRQPWHLHQSSLDSTARSASRCAPSQRDHGRSPGCARERAGDEGGGRTLHGA
jgi:hypothetical protein